MTEWQTTAAEGEGVLRWSEATVAGWSLRVAQDGAGWRWWATGPGGWQMGIAPSKEQAKATAIAATSTQGAETVMKAP
jgi:hypothetical protein